jgi:hypothetical protein
MGLIVRLRGFSRQRLTGLIVRLRGFSRQRSVIQPFGCCVNVPSLPMKPILEA